MAPFAGALCRGGSLRLNDGGFNAGRTGMTCGSVSDGQTAPFSIVSPDGVAATALSSLQLPPTQCDRRSFDSNSGTI